MEADPEVQKRREDLKRILDALAALLAKSDAALDDLASASGSEAGIGQMERLRAELAGSVQDYLDRQADFAAYVRERMRKMEQARSAAAMAEKRSRTARDDARIQELSEELTRDLRLQRVDNAIKELLDFLSDAEFFAANASTGRRRRLRALQNAIAKALET